MHSRPKPATWLILSGVAIAPLAGALFALKTLTSASSVPQSSASPASTSELASTLPDPTLAPGTSAITTAVHSDPSTDQTTVPTSPLLQAQVSESEVLDCDNPRYQLEMNQCAYLDYQRADEALNQTYRELMKTLSDARQEKLIAAERAWIRFRDLTCDFESSLYEGGSIQPLIQYSCLAELTDAQTLRLEGYLDN